jgi:hypothetical protein
LDFVWLGGRPPLPAKLRGQPEVDETRLAGGVVDEKVMRFDVSMDEAALVHCRQRLRHRQGASHERQHVRRPLGDELIERPPAGYGQDQPHRRIFDEALRFRDGRTA